MDARRGFEPQFPDSESSVLPLDERATKTRSVERATNMARGHSPLTVGATVRTSRTTEFSPTPHKLGAENGDRTHDLLVGKQTLYH